LGAGLGEFGGQIAEAAVLRRAAGGHRRRIEEQHHRTGAEQAYERAFLAPVIGQREVRREVSPFHDRTVAARRGG
jgi:hypothetical protein